MNEHDLTRQVKAWLRRWPGLFFFKVWGSAFQRRGLPDFVICVPRKGQFTGQFIGLELKHPEKPYKLTPEQEQVRKEIVAAGGQYRVAQSILEVEEFLQEVTEP